MGQVLRDLGLVPDLILSSTARRARETGREVARASGFGGEMVFEPSLYLGGVQAYASLLRRTADERVCVMVIGHNPDLEDLLKTLTGIYERLPTAALAHVEIGEIPWSELTLAGGYSLLGLWRPRELPPLSS